MDPTYLLTTNTPFDDNKLNILETIINTFYTTTNNQDRDIANKILNQFQELPEAFSYCDFILSKSQSPYTKTYCLGILESAIKTKWLLLPVDNRIAIRNFLVDILIKCVTDTNLAPNQGFFINKLNIVIVLIAKNEWTSTWPNFISEICNSSKSNQNLCENNMKVLQLMSEEINEFWKSSLTTQKALELKDKMSKEFTEVFYLCQFIFDNSQNVKQSLLIEAVKLFSEYTTWFPFEFVFNEKIISQFLNNLKTMNFIRVEVIKCIGQIFSIVLDINKLGNQNYLFVKNLTMQIYKNFITQMLSITNNANFAERMKSIDISKQSGFEKFTLTFENTLIYFFKNNFEFIESFDFVEGTSKGNDFLTNYLNEISIGLTYLTQFQQIQNDEIFKTACDFWYWFTFKLCFLKQKDSNPDVELPLEIYQNSLQSFILYTHEMFLYKKSYCSIVEIVRKTIISRMNKPLEVKIDIDENGDLTTDPTTNTIYQSLHDTMKDTLIYLTHLDPYTTQNILIDAIKAETSQDKKLNKSLLNSICWSVGCITGTMDPNLEKSFVIMVIKFLLNYCEIVKGKDNKSICASNIMYIVGQYPRFLNAHWKFLKTVVKKLFEFMHESHPGVQDFACETFLKISMKCGSEFVKKYEDEHEPHINVLVRTIENDTTDLAPHQKLMFYEAVGNIISHEENNERKIFLIEQLLNPTYNNWLQLFQQAGLNVDFFKNNSIVKLLELIIRINERVAVSTQTIYWSVGSKLFENLLKSFIFFSGLINGSFERREQMTINTRSYQSFNRTVLKYFISVIHNNDNQNMILKNILPGLGQFIEIYRNSHIDNRDPNILLVFSAVLDKLKSAQYDYIVQIWNYLCLFTLEMIKNDFQSYPEHRMNFFILLKSLISNAFDALFQVQESNFNKNVIDAISWAIRHNQPLLYETGLETLLILIKNILTYKIINNINIADLFYKAFYYQLMNDVLCILTDSYHKAGFKYQVEILQLLIQSVETHQVSEGIFDMNMTNKNNIMMTLNSMLSKAFQHLNKIQLEAFCIALFNKCYDYHEFKVLIRDFLISLRSFSGNNDELFEEEKKKQIEEARMIDEKKKQFIPGMMPIYDNETQRRFNTTSYQDSDAMN